MVWDRATGAAIAPAIVWQDRRTSAFCERHRDARPYLAERTGLILDPYFSATKIAWILDHVPGARGRAEAGELAAGTVDSFLIWHLTGGSHHVTDATNASRTMLMDLRTIAWADDLMPVLRRPRRNIARDPAQRRRFRHDPQLSRLARRPADPRRRRRPAGVARRSRLPDRRSGQMHLRHRGVLARPHRRSGGPLDPRSGHDAGREPRPMARRSMRSKGASSSPARRSSGSATASGPSAPRPRSTASASRPTPTRGSCSSPP